MVICISLSRMIFGDKSKYTFRDGEIKEKQLYVFERFYRVADATERIVLTLQPSHWPWPCTVRKFAKPIPEG